MSRHMSSKWLQMCLCALFWEPKYTFNVHSEDIFGEVRVVCPILTKELSSDELHESVWVSWEVLLPAVWEEREQTWEGI